VISVIITGVGEGSGQYSGVCGVLVDRQADDVAGVIGGHVWQGRGLDGGGPERSHRNTNRVGPRRWPVPINQLRSAVSSGAPGCGLGRTRRSWL
jgi:hypothetical protein